MIRVRLRTLRKIIRETLGASASGADPTDVDGFYSYELPRGNDVHGFWYRSPGRPMGQDGDPFRPADASAYIGLTPPSSEDTSAEQAPAGSEADEPTAVVASSSPAVNPEEKVQ